MANSANFHPYLTSRTEELVIQYDEGNGHLVDQAMLIQMESVNELLSGASGSSLSSSTSGSMNTSLDDWSDDSDEEVELSESTLSELQLAKDWLVSEF